jgi:hypothetical protein
MPRSICATNLLAKLVYINDISNEIISRATRKVGLPGIPFCLAKNDDPLCPDVPPAKQDLKPFVMSRTETGSGTMATEAKHL